MPTSRHEKSFFDQPTNIRPAWHTSRDSRAPLPPTKPAAVMPPIAASSQSRDTLRAFRFEQENAPPVTSIQPKAGNAKAQAASNRLPVNGSHKASQQESKECPQTPVGRLPLAELIASGEDFNQSLNLTPVERVLWDNSARASEQGSSQETPALPKSRKRAHSSSPVSSSQKKYKTSDYLATGDNSASLRHLRTALKTPQGDPASELWKKYTLNTHGDDKLSPTRIFGQPFSQLMNSSSPQTPAYKLLGRDSVGLRRSFSCGTEWPISAAKRRKLQPIRSNEESPTGNDITADGPQKSQRSKSRLSLLVAKLSGDLARPADDAGDELPTSSAKSFRHHNGHIPTSHSQSPQVQSAEDGNGVEQDGSPASHTTVTAHRDRTESNSPNGTPMHILRDGKEIDELSDDFGDDELDLETFDEFDALVENYVSQVGVAKKDITDIALPPRQGTESAGTVANQYNMAQANLANPLQKVRLPPLPPPTANAPSVPTDPHIDEFDDDDNDVSTEDLEDAIAIYEQGTNLPMEQGLVPIETEDPHTTQKESTVYGSSPDDSRIIPVVEEPDLRDTAALSEDEFGGDLDLDDMVAECDKATQGHSSIRQLPTSSARQSSAIQRYVIQTVAESYYETPKGQRRPEKVLLVKSESSKLSKAITLRESWVDSPCTPGSIVNLVGQFDRAGQCTVDDAHNFLILHPDYLISATVVADSFSCTRRAILQDRVKATGDSSQPQIYGSILHEIFQEALKANRWDTPWLETTIKTIAARYLEKLFEINVELETAVNHLKSRATELQAWAEVFVAAKPKATAFVKDRNGGQSLMSVNKLLEVEEKIWSPRFGLKGMIDATVQVSLQDGPSQRTLTVPLELKTGKNSTASHKAQTALYTLLCSDRYDVEIACGILYYMESSETSRVPAVRHELIHMIKQRNELAGYVRYRHELPPMLKNSLHLCGKCYAQTACFIYHKLVDDGNGEASGLKDVFDDFVKHLNPAHQTFFSKWDDLLTKEENDIVKFRREVWAMQSSERERVGRCFSGVVIEAGSYGESEDAPKINRYRYTFVKQKSASQFSFTESQITLGEPIVISDEKGHFALASGYVTSIRKSKVQVTVDRRLHNARGRRKDFDSQNNQSFAGIMEIVEDGTGRSTLTPPQPDEEIIYRIDKDEFSNGMAIVRNNLISIMEKDAFNAQPLRRLIVENAAPTFRPAPSSYSLEDSASQASLNVDQRAAIEKVMTAKDYALVLGMPGTGKTTTIAHIIRALTAQGKSVLLTSYTHTAVDNILLKIREDNIGVFRLGAVAKVHPVVQEFADLGGIPFKTIEELKRAYSQQVVATTCLGISHPIFSQRIFDYCIVDEASQITLPVCLGPIRMARTFILVGDHYQLPPLVQNASAREGGLDISLFKLLSDHQPSSVVNLEHQYRMCADIMTLSNTLIYAGRLKCGNPTVANRFLTIPNIDALRLHHHSPSSLLSSTSPTARICPSATPGACWLRDLLSPARKATFINTDPLLPASHEAASGARITNPFEATLCTQLVEALLTTGVPPTDIGVITLYRSQLALLKHHLRHRPAVEMHTADKFQGRDKEVVILSLVRNNEGGNVGELLRDWRRVNVALTRARTKLLVVGSKATMGGNELLHNFMKLMDGKGWVYSLPPGALEGHVFDEEGTQLSSVQNAIPAGDGNGEGDVKGEVKPAQGKENAGKKGVKVPVKTVMGKTNMKALMGRRPVLRDIVNDAA